jgi:hypothetical protein
MSKRTIFVIVLAGLLLAIGGTLFPQTPLPSGLIGIGAGGGAPTGAQVCAVLTLLGDVTSSTSCTTVVGKINGVVTPFSKGQISLATSSISSGACQTVTGGSVNSVAVTSLTTAATYGWNPSGSIKGVTGYVPGTSGGLSIVSYATSGNLNWDVCNWTSGAVTPAAVTLNWWVLTL